MTAAAFFITLVTGIMVMFYYKPYPEAAYESMKDIHFVVPTGRLIRNIHRWAANVMVVAVILHMARAFYTAAYRKPREFNWLIGMALLVTTLGLSFTGYLLPWDQLAYWAVTIGSSMAEAAPLFGHATNLLLRGGIDIGAGTLLRFYLLHIFALPMLTIILISVHYYAVRKQEISPIHELFDPASPRGKPTRRKVPFLPDQVFFETALIILLTFAFIAINYFFWDAHLESHANPNVTPQHTKAPWYFLWLQGMLKFGDKIFFGLILGPLVLILPILLPYLDRNPSRQLRHRKVAIGSGILVLLYLGFVSYAGWPTYGIQQVGSQEILTDFVPIEGEGVVDHAPWSALPDTPVIYEVRVQNGATSETITDQDGNAINPETLHPDALHLFEEFRHEVERWVRIDSRFVDPIATLAIEPWTYVIDEQTNQPVVSAETGQPMVAIKKATVTLEFISTEVNEATGEVTIIRDEAGNPVYSRTQQADFLHRDALHREVHDAIPGERPVTSR
jgi:ubiquinol-cytochrome c reductase cytochrome b subunit